ncbi:MAG: hypothetical protein ACREID_02720 [Planctomycetota bacterium]
MACERSWVFLWRSWAAALAVCAAGCGGGSGSSQSQGTYVQLLSGIDRFAFCWPSAESGDPGPRDAANVTLVKNVPFDVAVDFEGGADLEAGTVPFFFSGQPGDATTVTVRATSYFEGTRSGEFVVLDTHGDELERLTIEVKNDCFSGHVDLVLLIDTSTSMDVVAQELCDAVAPVAASLLADGIELNTTVLGIFEDQTEDFFYPCVPDSVKDALGIAVPGAGAELLDDDEDWGPAVAILSGRFAWSADPDTVRLIVTAVDEAPQNGDKRDLGASEACDFTDDAAIANAISQASGAGVAVSPFLVRHDFFGTGVFLLPDQCVQDHANRLASLTGGTVPLRAVDDEPAPGAVADILEALVRDAVANRP